MSSNKANVNLEEYEEYTPKELEYIDKFKHISENLMEVHIF